MFEIPIRLFKEYLHKCEKNDNDLFPINCEIALKLAQLEWLIHNVQLLHKKLVADINNTPNLQFIDEMNIYTESFYHFAFRLRDILKKSHPKFKSFEAVGVRNVRNHLVVHPEGHQPSKIFPTFSYSDQLEIGPKIKCYNGGTEYNTDRGLYINAKEFNDSLIKVFSLL